jgi:hypothetical protein
LSTYPNPFPGAERPPSFTLDSTGTFVALEIARTLSRLSAPTRSVPLRRRRSGRFDPKSAMAAERDPDDDRIFRSTERVRGSSRFSLVVALDGSWTMTYALYQTTWAAAVLVRAVAEAGGASAVVAFNDEARVVKPWDVPDLPRWPPFGFRSTDLALALDAVSSLLDSAEEGPSILVLLSDGEVGDSTDPTTRLAALRTRGVRSLSLHFRDGQPIGEDVLVRIRRPEDLAAAVGSFIETIEREASP